MQSNLKELTGDPEDKWLESSTDDMKKVTELVQDDLVKPTANLADLMYKSGKSLTKLTMICPSMNFQ